MRRGRLRTAAALFVLIVSVYLLTAAGRFANIDAESMFDVTRSLYTRGSLAVDDCSLYPSLQCVRGVDGRQYSAYGVVPSIAALPFFAAGRLAGQQFGVNPDLVAAASVSFMNSLVGALACVLFFLWAARTGYSIRESALATILLAFATPLWFHSTKEFYSEPLFALLLVGSFASLRSVSSRGSAAAAGLLFGLAVGTRVFGLMYLPILAGYAYLVSTGSDAGATSIESSRKSAVARTSSFLFVALICLAGLGMLNAARFGSPFNTGYHLVLPTIGLAFSTPPLVGLWRILFDGEVGLAWFSPLIFLIPFAWPRFHRQHRIESCVCLGVAGSTMIFFAAYTYWHGGWSYGPRLLTPILPFLIFPLVPFLSKSHAARPMFMRAGILVILIAVTVQVIGIVPPYSRHYYLQTWYRANGEDPWIQKSALVENAVAFPKVLSYAAGASAGVNRADRYLSTVQNSVNQLAPDIWWIKAGMLGAPWRLLGPFLLVLSAFAVAAGFRLRREIS